MSQLVIGLTGLLDFTWSPSFLNRRRMGVNPMGADVGKWTHMLREWSQYEYVQILGVLAAAWGLTALANRLIPWITVRFRPKSRFYALPWIPLLRLVILLGAIALIVPLVITPTRENVLALLGTAGLVIGFALKDYISCLISGIILLIERPYRVGDWVQIGDNYGEVVGIGLRTVELVTADNNRVTIPHSAFWNSPLSNATAGQHELLCVTHFYVEPNHDTRNVRQTLVEVALASPFLKLDRPIKVLVCNEPFGSHYKLKAYPMDAREQFAFITDLTERGQMALNEMGLNLVAAPVAVPTH